MSKVSIPIELILFSFLTERELLKIHEQWNLFLRTHSDNRLSWKPFTTVDLIFINQYLGNVRISLWSDMHFYYLTRALSVRYRKVQLFAGCGMLEITIIIIIF